MEVLRSGLLGMDAQQAPLGHGCPFGARPRSNAGVREVGAKRGPGHRSEGLSKGFQEASALAQSGAGKELYWNWRYLIR
jgi:hypothetical protein